MHFVLATHNPHKVKEIEAMLDIDFIVLQSLQDVGFDREIVETGKTFKENAWIKANAVYRELGGNVIAEDSGLEVDELYGAPGIYSARYAGQHKNNEDNIDKLLTEMKDKQNRKARFRSVLAVKVGEKDFTFEGEVTGQLAYERLGTGGFGYDPIFIPDGYKQSFGQLSDEIKNRISHRFKSFKKFQNFLLAYKNNL